MGWLNPHLKLPTRPAPEPPKFRWQKQSGSTSKGTRVTGDPFKLSRSQSVGKLIGDKKPPPRPPPPPIKVIGSKNAYSSGNNKQSSQLLPSIFSRKKCGSNIPKSNTSSSLPEQPVARKQTAPCGMLIDFNSPPSSPTLTAHSSSDGFSVNSFGSDGNNILGSQVESGFEDDFDLLMASGATTPSVLDPWSFDPVVAPQTPVPFELSNEDPRSRHKESTNSAILMSTKPTIIRPKYSKPARPPPPKLRPASTPPKFVSAPLDLPGDWSPPMPTCPPPPPPPEVLTTLEHGPRLPPRPSSLIYESLEKKKPYCIALYDYQAGHPDDLSFKVNDVIHLTEEVNNDWQRGTLMGKEGMFPSSYVKVVIPLESSGNENGDKFKFVIALFTFRAETWDDLPFQEGETVKVTKRINDDWLYGECNGRQGQFPENYVTDVSSLFPVQAVYS